MDSNGLTALIDECLKELELADTYLVDLKISGNKIEVFMDSDNGISFGVCHKVSRWIEAVLDEKKYFGEAYTLDVSSPGIGRPLKMLRQYPKNIGRTIEVKTKEKEIKGTLVEVVGDIIHVRYEDKIKEGKKNKKIIVTDEISYDQIIESKIKINFNA
jgi:ribosome maturation factor RimP